MKIIKTHKQEILKAIDEVKAAASSPVAIFTSNESHAKLLEEWFPDVKIHSVSEDYLPDSDKCYIIPIGFDPVKLITPFEEETQ